jgi:hypothetical protein
MTLARVKQALTEYTKPAKLEGLLPVIDLPTIPGLGCVEIDRAFARLRSCNRRLANNP